MNRVSGKWNLAVATRWPSGRRCSPQHRRVNGHMDKGAKDWKTMNHALSYAVSSIPAFCHRAQDIASTDGLHDRHGGTALNIPSLALIHIKFFIVPHLRSVSSSIRKDELNPVWCILKNWLPDWWPSVRNYWQQRWILSIF